MAMLHLGHVPARHSILWHRLVVGTPSSPHSERCNFWRKGSRRNKEVSPKGSREGQGTVAPMVTDSRQSSGSTAADREPSGDKLDWIRHD